MILILDGAFGTMAQRLNLPDEAFTLDGRLARGCYDVLCITRPEIVANIHRQYLKAGANIIETNSFSSNAITLADYGLEHRAADLARASAQIARQAVADFKAAHPDQASRPLMVAGSMGPTSTALTMANDGGDAFAAMHAAMVEQAKALQEGGADIFLIETAFDTLNAKTAAMAVREVAPDARLMISGTLSDATGRTLSGQTVEAFCASLEHARPWAIGLNCGFGARHLHPFLRRLSSVAHCLLSAHPNAGLPNVAGEYDETPEMFAADMEQYFKEGLLAIAGGCCGTTPAHIAALAKVAAKHDAPPAPAPESEMVLSGLEPLRVVREANFINIGERANVAGSAKFAKLIREGKMEEAVDIARAQVEAGAQVLDVCMDDALIDAPAAMRRYLQLLGSEPEIARVPIMIDSSSWDAIEAGLQSTQGKSIVNSISLKEGEEAFLRHARMVRSYGAAVVVMLFDEQGQADTYQRKIEVAERAYRLLTADGFPAHDIIFDPNVLAVATGIPAHDRYALDFIEATRWIKANLPGAKISGGVSNLSFAFRGNNPVRKAMHAAFLYHAIAAGMDMAIVNMQMVQMYADIDPELLERIEDLLLCRRPDAADRLAEIAQLYAAQAPAAPATEAAPEEQPLPLRARSAMLKGDGAALEQASLQAVEEGQAAIDVINSMLMPAMEEAGRLFGEGKMFLPQIVKCARAMKQAVDALSPYIAAGAEQQPSRGTVVLATVKGDVHDIGKNIVGVVLACNGYKVEDLGVMVPAEQIVEQARLSGAVAIGLSGLITPSLSEMAAVAREAERQGLHIPIIIGGATTSALHTALKIATATTAPVVHSRDAADTSRIVGLLTGAGRADFIAANASEQERLRQSHSSAQAAGAAPRRHVPGCPCCAPAKPLGASLLQPSIAEVTAAIDWSSFLAAWGIAGRYPEVLSHPEKGPEAEKLIADAKAMLADLAESGALKLKGVMRTFPARAEGDDIVLPTDGGERRLPMIRSEQGECVADFVDDRITLFALSAGFGLDEIAQAHRAEGDDYKAIMAKLLADRLAEAMAETVLPGGCRIAFGYPAAPDHSLKRDAFDLLGAEQATGMALTDNCMICPGESICGLWLPRGRYISVGRLSDAAVADYARRRGITEAECRRLMPDRT